MAHQGRRLQNTESLAHRRIREYPNEGFCITQRDRLFCQPCNKYVSTKKFDAKRHVGDDEKQNQNTNKGAQHKKKLRIWLNHDVGDDDMQDQLQRKWTEYATEFLQIQKQ
eukprot:233498_1